LKKRTKNLFYLRQHLSPTRIKYARHQWQKFFASFFSKKKPFLPCYLSELRTAKANSPSDATLTL